MATKFNVDVTRDIPVATASPAAAAEAIAMKGKALGQAIGFLGGQAFEAYKGFQDESARMQMEETKELFTGFAAQQKISQGEQLVVGAKEARKAAFETGDFELGSEKDVAVQDLSSRLEAMKETYSQNRIGLGEYLSRQQKLSREWIAKFPGRADEIRQEVARVSGVRGIEDYAFQTYLKDRFDTAEAASRRASQKADEVRNQNIKRGEALLNGGYVKGFTNASQVANAIEANDPNVVNALNQLDTEAAIERNTKTLEARIKSESLVLGEAGKGLTGTLIASASNASMQGLVKVREEFAPLAQKISQLRVQNGGAFTVSDVDKFRTELAPFQAKATGIINASYDSAVQQLSTSGLASKSSSEYSARLKEIQESRKAVLDMVNSDDMGTVSTMLEAISRVNKDNIASTFQLIQSQNEILKAHGIAAPDLFMLTNDPELFKKKYPRAYEILSTTVPGITAGAQRIAALAGSANVATIAQATQSSFAGGQTPSVDPKTREVVLERALSLDPAKQLSVVGGGVFPERPQMVGALSTILSSIPREGLTGPHIAYATKNYNNIKKAYDTMSPEEQGMLKQTWEQNISRLTGDRAVSAVVSKEVEAARAKGFDVMLVATPDGRYNVSVSPPQRQPSGPRDYTNYILSSGLRETEMFLRSVTGYANAITDINSLLSGGKIPTSPTPSGEQPAPGAALVNVSEKERAQADVIAIQNEIQRAQKKPSWISQEKHDDMLKILREELAKAQERAK